MKRKSYAHSFQELAEAIPLAGDPKPEVDRPPRADDAVPGPGLVRQSLESMDFFDLTLPGLYLERCELRSVSLAGSDLRLSTARWSDFARCDLSECDLSGSDLRGCTFEACLLRGAQLAGADLRSSTFEGCDFSDADLTGTVLHRTQAGLLPLTAAQLTSATLTDDDGAPSP